MTYCFWYPSFFRFHRGYVLFFMLFVFICVIWCCKNFRSLEVFVFLLSLVSAYSSLESATDDSFHRRSVVSFLLYYLTVNMYIIVSDMEGNIRIYRLPKDRGTDQSVYPDIALHISNYCVYCIEDHDSDTHKIIAQKYFKKNHETYLELQFWQ